MNDISILEMKTFTSITDFNKYDISIESGLSSFVFDESYATKHSPFLFEVADINLIDKQVTFDHYIGHEFYDSIEYENEPLTGFEAETIKLKFNTTTRNVVGSTVTTNTKSEIKTLNLSFNSKVNDVKARRTYYVSAMTLLASMGKMTAKELKLDVEYYDVQKYYLL